MTEADKAIIEIYKKQIADLEKEYYTAKQNQGEITGNQADVFQQVGQNMLAEKEFHDKKMQLENAIADIVGVSEGVTAFLDKTKKPLEFSKFDVDAGKEKIDNSLNPFVGKAL